MFRSALFFLLASIWVVLMGIYQRVIFVPILYLFPSRRVTLLTAQLRFATRSLLWLMRVICGMRFSVDGKVPGDGAYLIIMNHQSLLDIPVAITVIEGVYPKFVAKQSLGRGIPAVSKIMRLCGMALVDQGTGLRQQLLMLKFLGDNLNSDPNSLIIFPEGGRTPAGEIMPFKQGGLRAILSVSRRPVYLVVLDGFYKCAKFIDVLTKLHQVQGKVRIEGPILPPTDKDEIRAFISFVESRMTQILKEMRNE